MGTTNKDHSVFILSTFLFFLFPVNYSYTIYNITQSQSLSPGNTLVSPSHIFELGFFSPNQFSNQYIGIWYRAISPRTVVWVANRESPLSITDSQATLSIDSHGNLEILDRDKKSIWSTISSRAPSNSSSVATLLDNGSLVLKDRSSGAELWNSFDHLGDTALPGSVLGFNIETNKSYLLTSWKSENDPSPGKFSVGLSTQMPPEAFVWINGSTPYWRSGPWDKLKFIGIPDMYTNYRTDFDLVEDPGKGSTYFHLYGNQIKNFHLSQEGFIQIKVTGEDGVLFTSWQAPQNVCSIYGACGPFGVCNNLKTPICKCLRGFEPKSVREWNEGKWERGCVRRKNSLCDIINGGSLAERGKMDGFGKIDNVKLPDFYQFVEGVDNDCSMVCLNNCSCLAYAYVEGIGCLVWSEPLVDIQQFEFGGARLFFRLAHEELVEGHNKIKTIIISVTTILTCGVLGVIGFILHKRRARRNVNKDETLHVDSPKVSTLQDSNKLRVFDLHTVLKVTNDFNQTNKLGQGGFGSVYKGIMSDGSEVAIKRLSSNSGQGIQEFTTELILIAKLQHRNLVKLLGYCIENEEKILVYEFMPNKSLDSFIFDPTRGKLLNWASRLNIIHGIAKGLVYLHRDSCLRVIHRDLKVSNILLDEKMNPKISDFGLARMFQDTIDLENTKRIVGTIGYMAPEYAIGGVFSEKSDVFSYGVLILEIISGKKNNNFHYREERLSIIAYAWHLWSENRPIELLDETLAESFYESEVIRCIHIGLLCVQDHAVDRPTMPDVVHMLTNEVNRPRPKPPIFALQSSPIHDSQSQSGSRASVNELTMSAVACR